MRIKCKHCNTVLRGDKKGTIFKCSCGRCSLEENKLFWVAKGEKGKDYTEL